MSKILKIRKEQISNNWVAVAVASTLIVLSFSGCIGTEPANSVETPVVVDMVIYGDGWTVNYQNVSTTNDTVYALLLECASRYNFTVSATYYGQYDSMLVESINGTKNGVDNKYWQY